MQKLQFSTWLRIQRVPSFGSSGLVSSGIMQPTPPYNNPEAQDLDPETSAKQSINRCTRITILLWFKSETNPHLESGHFHKFCSGIT